MAERVGFELLSVVENKELKGLLLPHDPPDPRKPWVQTRIEHVRASRIRDVYGIMDGGGLTMPRTAKVFMTNRSQAVRLPKEYQFSTSEVFIRKEGEDVILSPRPRDWRSYLESAPTASDSFMADDDLPVQEREA